MAVARTRKKPARAVIEGSKRGDLPDFVAPCLALRVDDPPEGDEWVHEIKFDGYRLEARIDHGVVTLLTRNGLDWTARFASVAKALASLDVEAALLDGEVVVEIENGTTSFTELVADLKAGISSRMVYYAFDLLHLDGADLRGATLLDRKAALGRLLGRRRNVTVRLSEHITGSGERMLDNACELGLEGIISKRADRPYRSGRTGDWLKITCSLNDEFVIGGYLDSTAQVDAVGALALGAYERGRLVYVGRVGTGFTQRTARELWQLLQSLRTKASPFADPLDATQRRGVRWVRPQLVVQVQYRAWTGDRLLRHGAFKGLREDKPARSIRHPHSKS
jgi:bifunctional non-homologous end joining protein LigD